MVSDGLVSLDHRVVGLRQRILEEAGATGE